MRISLGDHDITLKVTNFGLCGSYEEIKVTTMARFGGAAAGRLTTFKKPSIICGPMHKLPIIKRMRWCS